MWQINDEIEFFNSAINSGFANTKDLFYDIKGKYFAYIPKNIKS